MRQLYSCGTESPASHPGASILLTIAEGAPRLAIGAILHLFLLTRRKLGPIYEIHL